ncbi:hypothetical protein [Pedobacter insulae]|uniref:Uncharacterized protein n=1 Tax=Pedobacter insulae TaxID=414048 RepID=A0A1I2W1N7_9SPHI|nr:hypothetical protein [Pedobacter insulae]SFG95290.1 hypothetical protein SAMN04489864_103408 [Pedobacter insulae]
MKKVLVIVMVLPLLFNSSCKKEKATILSAMVEILLVNQQSQNLLNSSIVLHENNIDIYFVKDGQPILFNQSNLSASKGFLIKPLDGLSDIGLKVYPYTGTPETNNTEYPITLIKLGDFGTDTIKCEILNGENSKVISKVWYNGILKYDQDLKQGPRRFTVVK